MVASIENMTAVGRRTLDGFFSASVRKHPSRPALYVGGRLWTYLELETQCARVEHALRITVGASIGRNVGLVYGKSVFSYSAVIAIMRSGSVYVPLNPKQPAERLLRIIADAQIETLLVDAADPLPEGVVNTLQQARPLQIITDEAESGRSFEHVLESAPQHRICGLPSRGAQGAEETACALAYIIYTSGSTGLPKGVAITQESACRCIEKLHDIFETTEQDRFTQFSALSFDVSIADLFWCWKSGGTLYVPAHSDELVPLRFAATHAVTVWSSVPSIVNFLVKLRQLRPNALPSIRLSLFAGEALPTELAQAWAVAAPQSRIFNVYGPTECTVYSTYYEYQAGTDPRNGVVPIGLPLPGLRYLIVDDGQIVEGDDTPGELWLSGDQLAAGYWNNPKAAAKAFVCSPAGLDSSDIWYRTGDLVSRRAPTGLTFRGRLDRQLKLRGYRIELQEIESALRDVTGSTVAAVIPLRGPAGICEKIVAYCDVLNADEVTVKARCLSRLAQYMVPERIFQLAEFPLSDHGKIDYLALAARAEAAAH